MLGSGQILKEIYIPRNLNLLTFLPPSNQRLIYQTSAQTLAEDNNKLYGLAKVQSRILYYPTRSFSYSGTSNPVLLSKFRDGEKLYLAR